MCTSQPVLSFHKLFDRRVDVWSVSTAAPEIVVSRYEAILAPDEAKRADRFKFCHLRRAFVLSRGALRILLGAYLKRAPSAVQFRYGLKGKPRVAGRRRLEFSASHSGGLAMFAFTLDCELGIDVEQIRPVMDMQDIATHFFCPEEAAELKSLSAIERKRAFFFCWTRKEAYIKAVGDGLSARLDSFRVSLRPNEIPRFVHIEHDTSVAQDWTLHNLEAESGYGAALAYRDARRPVHLIRPVQPSELLRLAQRWAPRASSSINSGINYFASEKD